MYFEMKVRCTSGVALRYFSLSSSFGPILSASTSANFFATTLSRCWRIRSGQHLGKLLRHDVVDLPVAYLSRDHRRVGDTRPVDLGVEAVALALGQSGGDPEDRVHGPYRLAGERAHLLRDRAAGKRDVAEERLVGRRRDVRVLDGRRLRDPGLGLL